MNQLRARRAIGQDLDCRMVGIDQAARLIALTSEYAESVEPGCGDRLDHVENLHALLAGAACLLRATADAMAEPIRELTEVRHDDGR